MTLSGTSPEKTPNQKNNPMKKSMMILLVAGLTLLGATTAAAQSAATQPKSVIHVVTVAWKEGTTPEQIQAALDGVKALPTQFKGITRVWTKSVKVQNPEGTKDKRSHAFVMEFADEAALKAYADSDAQKKWYETYVPIRGSSSSYDITN